MQKLFVVSTFYFFFFSISAQEKVDSVQQNIEPVMVTATKFEEQTTKLASTAYVFSSEDLREQPGKGITEFLNQLPGIHIQESLGNFGSPQLYSVRGGRSKDILFLINGNAVGDASQINLLQDLNLIPIEQVQRIEVVFGGSSTLYGANASAAVINVILKNPENSPFIQSSLELGKWGTIKQSFKVGGQSENSKLSYSLYNTNYVTEGFSAALDTLGTQNFDRDSGSRHSFGGQLTVKNSEHLKISLLNDFVFHKYEFDGGAFIDGSDEQENSEIKSLLSTEWKQRSGGLLTAKLSWIKNNRKQFSLSSVENEGLFAQFKANSWKMDVYEVIGIGKTITTAFGGGLNHSSTDQFGTDFFSGDFVQNISKDSATITTIDPYISFNIDLTKHLRADVGSRLNNHSDYGNNLVYHGKLAFELLGSATNKLNIRSGIATAYITPSLFQLYSSFGSRDLQPEEATTTDVGFNYSYKNKLILDASAFYRDESSIIGFSNTTFTYANGEEDTYAKGIESSLSYNPSTSVKGKIYASIIDRKTNEELFRLPQKEWGVLASLKPAFMQGLTFTADYRRVGQRTMPLFNSSTFMVDEFDLEGYNSLNVTAAADLWKNQLQTYIAARNLTNNQLTDNLGYTSENFNIKVGANFRLN